MVPLLVGHHLAGHQGRLAVDREGAAGLVDVGGLAHQPGGLVDLRLAAAGHDHDLDAGPVAGLQARAPGPARSRPRRRGTASCPCRAGCRRGRCRRIAVAWCGRYGSGVPWKLADTTLDLELPVGGRDRQRHRRLDVRGGAERHPRAGGRATGRRWSRPASTCSTSARWRRAAGRRSRPRRRRRRWSRRSRGWRGDGRPDLRRHLLGRGRGRALAAGAAAVNDISGGSDEMFELVAGSGCGYVLMHIEGPPRVDRRRRRLRRRRRPPQGLVRGASRAGAWPWVSPRSRSRSTPASTSTSRTEQDLEILRRLGELRALGLPLYVSLSRKDFIGAVLAGSWEERWPAGEREWGTVAAVALAVRAGADILRIHDRSLPAGDQGRRRAITGRPPDGDKSLLETPWAIAIDPARRDGRIVAESSEEERGAKRVAMPGSLDPGLRRGAGAGRRRAPLLAPARGARGRRLLATW